MSVTVQPAHPELEFQEASQDSGPPQWTDQLISIKNKTVGALKTPLAQVGLSLFLLAGPEERQDKTLIIWGT